MAGLFLRADKASRPAKCCIIESYVRRGSFYAKKSHDSNDGANITRLKTSTRMPFSSTGWEIFTNSMKTMPSRDHRF